MIIGLASSLSKNFTSTLHNDSFAGLEEYLVNVVLTLWSIETEQLDSSRLVIVKDYLSLQFAFVLSGKV